MDWNRKRASYNWELVFCELYAGGKYDNESSENYEFSLGLNGLGSCATQYASRYMDVTVWREGKEYSLHFERGEIVGQMSVREQSGKKRTARASAGCRIWRCSPTSTSRSTTSATRLKRQAVVNAGVTFRLRNQANGKLEPEDFVYEHGIADYIRELAGDDALTDPSAGRPSAADVTAPTSPSTRSSSTSPAAFPTASTLSSTTTTRASSSTAARRKRRHVWRSSRRSDKYLAREQ